ncbi:MAG: methyltransferase domain-containing protein [Bacteroidetes bacterium]|nr:methyltransferase domain-containing protein [Bacteroidota bacterium]
MLRRLFRTLFNERQRNALYHTAYLLRGWWYRGHRYDCICCGHSFRRFLPYGHTQRPLAACPRCNSLERTRLLWYYLKQETPLFQHPLQVLHFAPEPRLETQLAKVHTSGYVSADLNPHLARTVVDIQAIPYPDNHFDWILCSHVLGHVPDEPRALRELYRVLKSGGTALLLTLQDRNRAITFEDAAVQTPAQRLAAYGEPDLMRLHGLDFPQRIAAAGFVVEERDYRMHFTPAAQETFRLGDGTRERIWVCRKP